ncbi:MAG: hypothetical protein MJY56_08475, partial [Bacteroidales bacterium]|nr:hypothetical protein [Bacteroidales bacterium]
SETTPEWGVDVSKVEQTWWYRVMDDLGLELLVNSSYSGSTVGYTGYDGKDFKAISFITRAKDVIEARPDVLFICGGTNDSWSNAPLGEIKYEGRSEEDLYSFLPAFCELIEMLTEALPDTRIINICNSELKPEVMDGEREICAHYGVENLQLYNIQKQQGHPSIAGMAEFASQVVRKYRSEASFIEAEPVWAENRETEKNLTLSFLGEAKGGLFGRKAVVRIAASTDHRLYVNKKFVAHGHCVAAHGFYRMDEYPVRLRPGRNHIAFEVAGYNEPSYYLLDQPSFLEAEVVAGDKVLAATGRDIKAYEFGQRRQDIHRFSFQRPFAEEYSYAEGYSCWRHGDTGEAPEVVLAVQPEKKIIERGVAYPDYRIHKASPVSDNVYAFETNSSGFLIADVAVLEPSKLVLKFDELLGEDGPVSTTRLTCAAYVTYNLEPGFYNLETFEPYTMKYVEAEIEGNASIKSVRMRDYCNSDVHAGEFSSSDEGLNRLFETARETLRQSSLDVFMDTPSRERAGWLCDSFFSSRVSFDLSGNTRLEHNFLENFLLPEKFDDIDAGMLPMCYPSDHWNRNYIPNWAMWFVIELEEYLGRSGDRELVDRARRRVYDLIDYFKPYKNEYGLLENLSKWVFVEWSDAANYVQDVSYPSNMLYAGMLDAAARMYGDAELADEARALRQTIREMSFDGTWFCDNAVRNGGVLERTDNHTEACQYYAFYFGAATPELYSELFAKLVNEFGPVRTPGNNPYPDVAFANAFIGNYLRLEILSREGYTKNVLDNINGFFTKMADLTGTLWENMSTNASCNHGFASHIAHVMYRDGLGIASVDPLARKVTL